MRVLLSSPLLWIAVSIFAYELGLKIKAKFKYSFLNPLVLGSIFVGILLIVTNTDVETYSKGGDFIGMFLTPATAVLALPIYRQRKLLKENFLPIILGAFVGSLVSMISIIIAARMVGLPEVFVISLTPKSVTTAIGLELSVNLGGLSAITMVGIMISGIGGAIIMPSILKVCKINEPIAKGIAMGTASHAVGTSVAIEMGETEGAMSGLAIGMAGLITVILSTFLPFFL